MLYKNYFNFDLKINGADPELGFSNFSFKIHDSIHEFYPTCNYSINDPTGLYRDYLISVEGSLFEVSYGNELYKNNKLTCEYVLASDEIPNSTTNGLMNGFIVCNLVHSFYKDQNCESVAYKKRISDIVKTLVDTYPFKSKTIENTEGTTIWYQLLKDQKSFIVDTLLPNAFSSNHNDSPFFAFIDCANNFYFVPYSKLIKETPVAELVYRPIYPDSMDINVISDIKPFRTGSTIHKSLRARNVYYRDMSTGEYKVEKDSIRDYPKLSGNLKYPAIYNKSLITSYKDLSWKYTESGLKESYSAKKIVDEKNGLFPEKLVITTMFNPKLTAGKTVNIATTAYNENGELENLLYTSGNYLIEESTHTWIGNNTMNGNTEIIVSRKYVNVPNSHSIGSKF